MKVLKGAYKGVELAVPMNGSVRPTVDHFRKHILRVAETTAPKVVWDLFAGSGGVGIELMSNWGSEVIFVEQLGRAMDCLKLNAAECQLKDPLHFSQQKWEFILAPVEHFLKKNATSASPPNLVFLDPPYGKNILRKIVPHLLACPLVDNNTRILIEHATDEKIEADTTRLEITSEIYGPKSLTLVKIRK